MGAVRAPEAPITLPIIIESVAPDDHREPGPFDHMGGPPMETHDMQLASPPPRGTSSRGESKGSRGDQSRKSSRKDNRESRGDQLKKPPTRSTTPKERQGKGVRKTPSMERRDRETGPRR